MQARVTVTRASVGSISRASGTFSMRTSRAPYITVARTGSILLSGFALPQTEYQRQGCSRDAYAIPYTRGPSFYWNSPDVLSMLPSLHGASGEAER